MCCNNNIIGGRGGPSQVEVYEWVYRTGYSWVKNPDKKQSRVQKEAGERFSIIEAKGIY